ncbi:hypothetical protein H6F86_20595 [Phormidium sp. FACHB-592]|uniref:Uncharacterized protein n=1 Tax=Stenomitos frigidus AS-A4 TaxID=2933935 RepID=A0ABV0KEG9_9CYAN|nr:hypothetical protein [Phormidium sp. FACHB-592]MBD2076232.1 hypothetical protein [Phormidium sp. FACHB-592]
MQIKLRDRTYEANDLTGLKIIPLASVLGMDAKGQPIDLSTMREAERATYAALVLQRLSEPSNHHRIAYSLKAIVPDIDPDLCSYELVLLPNGSRQELVTLDLELEELINVFAQLQGVELEPETVPQRNGFQKPRPVVVGDRRR